MFEKYPRGEVEKIIFQRDYSKSRVELIQQFEDQIQKGLNAESCEEALETLLRTTPSHPPVDPSEPSNLLPDTLWRIRCFKLFTGSMVKFDLGMLADAISVVGLVLIVFVFLYAPKNGVPDTEGYPTSANSTALSFPWALRRFNTARSVEHRIPLGQSGKPFSSTRPLTYEDYTVGWICALPIEMAAAKAMLDEVHPDLPANPYDDNTYILGTMRSHNAAIACLPTGVIGSAPAAMVATNMLSIFRSIRFGLLVGIGGGVPFQADIRLGDVLVAKSTKNNGGVVQYNYTKTIKECTLKETCTLNKPPRVLLTALSKLQASHLVNGNETARSLSEMATKYPLMISILRPQNQGQLFRSEYHHIGTNHTCNACDTTQLQTRAHRKDNTTPRIHYGLMASGNQVVKDGSIRDHLARQSNIWCFEMEAADLMDKFPCLVIRGISDYADSHKNDTWQGYAAATAAAYAKELLSVIPTHQVEDTPSVAQVYAS